MLLIDNITDITNIK